MKEKTITKAEIEKTKEQEKEKYKNNKGLKAVALSDEDLNNVTGGFKVWKYRDAVVFKFTFDDEVEVYDEPYFFRVTTERVRITDLLDYHYDDDDTWGPGYCGIELKSGKYREFQEWEIQGCDRW